MNCVPCSLDIQISFVVSPKPSNYFQPSSLQDRLSVTCVLRIWSERRKLVLFLTLVKIIRLLPTDGSGTRMIPRRALTADVACSIIRVLDGANWGPRGPVLRPVGSRHTQPPSSLMWRIARTRCPMSRIVSWPKTGIYT